MEENELQEKTFELAIESLKAVENNNKRLFVALIICALSISVTVIGMTWCYFFSDYQYPTVTQNQAVGSAINQNAGKGVNDNGN